MARKKRIQLPLRQIFFSLGAVGIAIMMLLGLNQFLGTPLPLPGMDLLEERANQALDVLYNAAGISDGGFAITEGDLRVHFIDVGQADCILIQTPDQNVLIDAGETNSGATVNAYLKAQGVKQLDLLIATHPHADHIGGMADVVKANKIQKILFSKVPENLIPTTKTYEKLLDAIGAKGLKITRAKPGAVYELGAGAVLTILGPIMEHDDDLNESSVVCRLEFGEISFLFTGDASKKSEDDLLNRYSKDVGSTVLKLGHHGSDTSSQEKWLNAVKPQYAVAQVGYDNTYGHPSASILRRLKDRGIDLYRTDQDGSVVFMTDGKSMRIETEK